MEFDSKKSKTLMEDGEIKVISNVTCISDASFLEFYQLPVYIDEEGKEKEDGTGETHGKELHKVVKKFKAEESVTYIGADSTKVNTGHKSGTIEAPIGATAIIHFKTHFRWQVETNKISKSRNR